ncbi:hypothetical protein AB0H76_09675 [Nocardia sp. NPDC050712]|uniref:hypothetical protein n=1 Tax=Nocardia sp. NPDC050712 TaxID=3155518 RepID=UPI0033EC6389
MALYEMDPRHFFTVLFTAATVLGYTYRPDGASTILVSGPDSTARVSLDTLHRHLSSEPPGDWVSVLADHLATAITAADAETQAPLDLSDYAAVGGLLRTRLYGEEDDDEDHVTRPWAPGLIQRLLLDGVQTVVPVRRDWLRYWPALTDTELFALAEDHVRADGQVQITRAEFGDIEPMAAGLPLFLLTGPEYLTTHASWLDAHGVTGPAGALFIVPAKETIYCYPITDLDVIRAATVLAHLAHLVHERDPWPITPWLYHWHHGTISLAAATDREGDTVYSTITPRFQRFLNSLTEPTEAGP